LNRAAPGMKGRNGTLTIRAKEGILHGCRGGRRSS
jgi:hypothetical protein